VSQVPYPIGDDNFEQFYETSSPVVVARINGACYFIEEFDVDLNAHGATSSGSLTLPIKGNPDFSKSFANVGGTAVTGEIFVGTEPPGWNPSGQPSIDGLTRVYYGLVAQYDPKFAGDRVQFQLRSLASPLVDEKIQQLATNVKTVDFIARVCAQFGLQFQAQLGSAPITVQEVLGEMYVGGADFSATIHGMRIWDLILQCATFDNVDVWEDQGTVYYANPAVIERPLVQLAYGQDLTFVSDDGLTGSHALMFAKDVQVEVRSGQPRVSSSNAVRIVTNADASVSITSVNKITTGNPQWGTPNIVTTTYSPSGEVISTKQVTGGKFSTGYTSQGKESTAQRYIFPLRNASPAACNAYAISQWRKISQEEYTVQMRIPLTEAVGIIPVTALLNVSNVPYSKFNTQYYPRTLALSGGSERAFMFEIGAVSHVLGLGAV
jgi:hypothetical protein